MDGIRNVQHVLNMKSSTNNAIPIKTIKGVQQNVLFARNPRQSTPWPRITYRGWNVGVDVNVDKEGWLVLGFGYVFTLDDNITQIFPWLRSPVDRKH